MISFVCLNKFSSNSIIIIFYRLPYFLSHFIFCDSFSSIISPTFPLLFCFFSLLIPPFYIIIFGFMSFFAKCFSIRLIQFLISYLHYVLVKWLQMKLFILTIQFIFIQICWMGDFVSDYFGSELRFGVRKL